MKKLLILTAVLEGLTGLTFFAYPSLVVRLLFGSEIAGLGLSISRFAGIILISLGIACWPDHNMIRAFYGMLTYNLLAMLYLFYMGVNGTAGILLWPAIAVHAVLSALLFLAWRKERQAQEASKESHPRSESAKAHA
jgi:hypothetical protein